MAQNTKKVEDTKARLIKAAGEVFAQHGFRASTVRQICQRARTNVGSVNYHFRDKQGLYKAIFGQSLQLALTRYPPDLGLTDQASPEEKLRAYVHSLLLRLMGEGLPAWHGKLLAREIAEPSGVLGEVVEHSVRPLYTYLGCIVRELRNEENTSDEGDSIFLTSLSIVGQCFHHHIASHMIESLCPHGVDPFSIEQMTDHITRFSLGGIRALGAAASRQD